MCGPHVAQVWVAEAMEAMEPTAKQLTDSFRADEQARRGPRDVLGRTIATGETVAYPDRHGSSLWLNTGIVKQIRWSPVTGEPTALVIQNGMTHFPRSSRYKAADSVVTRLDRVVLVK